MVKSGKYDQREPVHPPVVTIRSLRRALHWTLDELADRVAEHLGTRPTKGALSAIEGGLRGASTEMLRALELAFDIDSHSIDTQYTPRATTKDAAA